MKKENKKIKIRIISNKNKIWSESDEIEICLTWLSLIWMQLSVVPPLKVLFGKMSLGIIIIITTFFLIISKLHFFSSSFSQSHFTHETQMHMLVSIFFRHDSWTSKASFSFFFLPIYNWPKSIACFLFYSISFCYKEKVRPFPSSFIAVSSTIEGGCRWCWKKWLKGTDLSLILGQKKCSRDIKNITKDWIIEYNNHQKENVVVRV